jgi:hypothetical protein
MSGFHATDPRAGGSALESMPSIPTDTLLDENDLMHIDDALNFEMDDTLGFGERMGGLVGETGLVGKETGVTDVTRPIQDARHGRGPSNSGVVSGGFTMGSADANGTSSDDPDQLDGEEKLDPSNPKHKRRIQNRLASARFRAKAKDRQGELDKLKHQVTQLRREKRDLEEKCVSIKANSLAEAERQRASTMAWIVDHFWLRRKLHFKTLANCVRWMVSGKYKPGMSNAVAELMAAQTAQRSAEGDVAGVGGAALAEDQDLSGFGEDDAPAGSADPSVGIAAGSPSRILSGNDNSHFMDETGSEASTPPGWGQRMKMLLSDSFKARMKLSGNDPESDHSRPHTR